MPPELAGAVNASGVALDFLLGVCQLPSGHGTGWLVQFARSSGEKQQPLGCSKGSNSLLTATNLVWIYHKKLSKGYTSHQGKYGGPKDYTGLRVTCRQTSLLVSCAQPEKPACQSGQVVNSISFNENQFKVGCCRLQSLLGAKFTPQSRKQMPYNDFEGYYCPVVKDNTGAMVYSKTSIKQLGEPGNVKTSTNWTLSWDRSGISKVCQI